MKKKYSLSFPNLLFIGILTLIFLNTKEGLQAQCLNLQQKWYMNYYEVDFSSGTPTITPTPFAPPPMNTGSGQQFVNVANGYHDASGNLLLYTVWIQQTMSTSERYDLYNGSGNLIGSLDQVHPYGRELKILPFQCNGNDLFLVIYDRWVTNPSGNNLVYVIVDPAVPSVSTPYNIESLGFGSRQPTFAVRQQNADGTYYLYSNAGNNIKRYLIDFSQCSLPSQIISFSSNLHNLGVNFETSELELSPDGTKLVFAQRYSNQVTVMDLDANGNSLGTNPYSLQGGTPFQDRINGLEFNDDASKLFVGYESSTAADGIYVLDVNSGVFGGPIPNTADYDRSQLELAPDCYLYAGNYFAATDENRLARIDPNAESFVTSYLLPGNIPYQAVNVPYNEGEGIFTLPDLTDCAGAKGCPSEIDTFLKIAGDAQPNRPNRVKRIGDFLYVCGSVGNSPNTFGTFSQYDLVGNLNWTVRLDSASNLFDFVPIDDPGTAFLVVGRSEPWTTGGANWQDNRSIVCQISDQGVINSVQTYLQNGRESFTHIVRIPNPTVPTNQPFYIIGADNNSNSPSSDEHTVVLNVNQFGQLNWRLRYRTNNADTELYKHAIALSNGNIALFGDYRIGTGQNYVGGVMIIDGTGIIVAGGNFGLTADQFINTATEVGDGSGDLYVAGEDRTTGQAFLGRVTNIGNPVWSVRASNQSSFRSIGEAGDGSVYVLGRSRTNNFMEIAMNFLTRISFDSNGMPVWDWSRYIDDDETAFSVGDFDLLSEGMIAYVDGREDNPVGAGSFDHLLSLSGLGFNDSPCMRDTPEVLTVFTFTTDTPNTVSALSAATALNSAQGTPLGYVCSTPCGLDTCTADFSYAPVNNDPITFCGRFNFTDLSTSTSPIISWAWDFGDPASGTDNTSTAQNPSHLFSSPNNTYNVCLMITSSSGCTDTYCENVAVNDFPTGISIDLSAFNDC